MESDIYIENISSLQLHTDFTLFGCNYSFLLVSFLEAKWNGDGIGASDKAMCLQNAKGRNSQKSVRGSLALRRRPKSRSHFSGPKVQVEPAFRSQGLRRTAVFFLGIF
jgi:hypothetical protein